MWPISPCTSVVAWATFLCVIFSSLAVLAIFLSVTLEDLGKQDAFIDYNLTILMLYAYFRLFLLVSTDRVLKHSSPIYQDMPESLQRDAAFMFVDGPSFLLWFPLGAYAISIILHERDILRVLQRIGPTIFTGSAVYQLDRFLHLFNDFRWDRCIHHVLTCLWLLIVKDWLPIQYKDFSFIFFAFAIDICLGKIMYVWFFVVRFARRHARNSPDWSFTESCGADCVIVPSAPERMAFYGKIAVIYSIAFGLVIPAAMEAIYLFLYREQVSWIWKIVAFPMQALYFYVDLPLFLSTRQASKVSYWTNMGQQKQTVGLEKGEGMSQPSLSANHGDCDLPSNAIGCSNFVSGRLDV